MKQSALQLTVAGVFLVMAAWNGYRAFSGTTDGELSWQRLAVAALLAGVAVAVYFSKAWKN
jgi:hypothetical protein